MQQAFVCPSCGSPTAPGQRFCGSCGAQLSTNCPHCGTYVSPGFRFCGNCGAAVSGGIPQQPAWSQQQAGRGKQQPGYPPPAPQQAQPLSVGAVPRGKFSIASVLLLVASIILIVSPSLVWFRAETTLFGMSMPLMAVKGSELGDLSSLMRIGGESLFARGEYVIVLGALALVLTIVSFFVLRGRKLIAALIGIAAVVCLLIGIEPTIKLMEEGVSLGEGIYLLFGSSLLLLIGTFKLP